MPANRVNTGVGASRHTATTAWLSHLRLIAAMPYPGQVLMPMLMTLARAHIDGSVFSFMWLSPDGEKPAALWIDPVNEAVYRGFIAGHPKIFDEYPVQTMIQTRGRAIRLLENTPEYELGPMYRHVLHPFGVHWGMGVPVALGNGSTGFANVCRRREQGRYSDDEWTLWDRFSACLTALDRSDKRWQMPPCPDFLETDSATLWLDADGRILTHGPSMRRLLFLLQENGLGSSAWSRCDSQALPPEVREAAASCCMTDSPPRRELTLNRDAGRFHFVIERMQSTPELPQAPLCITIRHHEPVDLAAAQRLWGWAMSPQEKRILIATARHASLSEMAENLDISLGTLKAYNNDLLARFQADSRPALLAKVLASRCTA